MSRRHMSRLMAQRAIQLIQTSWCKSAKTKIRLRSRLRRSKTRRRRQQRHSLYLSSHLPLNNHLLPRSQGTSSSIFVRKRNFLSHHMRSIIKAVSISARRLPESEQRLSEGGSSIQRALASLTSKRKLQKPYRAATAAALWTSTSTSRHLIHRR